MSRRDFRDFLYQLAVFFVIAGILLVLNVAQRWLVETLKVKLREGMDADLIRIWMLPRRAFWLANAGPIGVNPDQRMHEDARQLCELSADLGIGLLQSSILLVASPACCGCCRATFASISPAGLRRFPGFMLWAAVLYAGAGSLVSYWVGGTLIDRNAERYAREADLRFSLVRVNEHVDGISLAAGEEDESRRVELHLAAVLAATPPAGHRTHQSDLGHGGLRLGHAGGADPGRRAAVLHRQDHLRRPDDGGRGIHPGAVLAALVRG